MIVSNGRTSREVLEELGLEDSPEIQPKGGGLSGFIRPDIIKFDVNREPVQPLPEDSMRKGVIHHLPESGQKLGTV